MGGYCRLQMPLKLALAVRGTVAGRRLGALEGRGGGYPRPLQCIPAQPCCVFTPATVPGPPRGCSAPIDAPPHSQAHVRCRGVRRAAAVGVGHQQSPGLRAGGGRGRLHVRGGHERPSAARHLPDAPRLPVAEAEGHGGRRPDGARQDPPPDDRAVGAAEHARRVCPAGVGQAPRRSGGQARGASEGKGRPQRRLGRRLEEVAKAVGGGFCPLHMPLRLALGVRGTVAAHWLDALEGWGTTPLSNASVGAGLVRWDATGNGAVWG